MEPGCYTALVTPFTKNDTQLDQEGLNRLIAFQLENGIDGIVAVGTTGECSTLRWEEHNIIIDQLIKLAKGRAVCVAGTGSNNTREAIEATRDAYVRGIDAVLLVEPYYNGPSSLEIRKEYLAPIAAAFPDIDMIPYIVPARTGTKLLPEDLAILSKAYPNVRTVKEATGDFINMRRIRELCGADFSILSGDDAMFYDMAMDTSISATGIISVVSNVAPRAMVEFAGTLESGNKEEAKRLKTALDPLFDLVTVTTQENSPFGKVSCRARNPLAIKTFMALLGMPVGPCRAPLGKMTRKGLDFIISIGRKIHSNNPEILQPAADFFGIDLNERLYDPVYQDELFYGSY
jgi:4-hydroxy-tetrahydrodipicolinate synthase